MNVNDLNNTSQTDWAALEAMNDEDIDYSDIPPLTDEFFETATLRIPASQARNLIQLDADVMAWFREKSGDRQNMINAVLREYIEKNNGK